AAPTKCSSAVATPIRPPAAASARRPTSSQPYPCWRSTAGRAGATPSPPVAPRRGAAPPRRGSWSTLCTHPQKPQKPQKPPPELFLWILWFLRCVVGVPNEGLSAPRAPPGRAPQSRAPPPPPAVTLSNETAPSRSRPCPRPPAA